MHGQALTDDLIEAMRRRGQEPPPEMIKPDLLPGLARFVEAFTELSTCRALGMGAIGPIPWTAVRAMADEWGLEGDAREHFAGVIRAMDGAFLAHVNKPQRGAS